MSTCMKALCRHVNKINHRGWGGVGDSLGVLVSTSMFLRVLHRGIDKSMEQSGIVTRLPSRGSSKVQKQTFESK